MSWALQALILIRLDAHQGEWCSLEWLAGRLLQPVHKLRPMCEQLVADGNAESTTSNGRWFIGVRVSGPVPASFNDVMSAPCP